MLPTFLVCAWFALPVFVWGAMFFAGRQFHPVLICILCFASMIGGVAILANYVWSLDAQLLAEIDKYEPGTPEAERASEEWASDTGRSFLLLLSPVLTGVWYGILFLSLFGFQRIVHQRFPAPHASVNSDSDSQTAKHQVDNGNPYQSPFVE